MAVVAGKSTLIHDDFGTADPALPQLARGRPIVACGTVTNGATDSNLSTYHLVDLPSDCILSAQTFFDVENWGFAQVVIGTLTDTDALLDVARAAATIQRPKADGDANHGKMLWEMLGIAADPGGMISLYAHAEAGATGAGSMPFEIHYRHR